MDAYATLLLYVIYNRSLCDSINSSFPLTIIIIDYVNLPRLFTDVL